MSTFSLIITGVGEVYYEGEAQKLTVPAKDGVMTILPHHEAFVSTLMQGALSYTTADGVTHTQTLTTPGVVEIAHNHVTVLL